MLVTSDVSPEKVLDTKRRPYKWSLIVIALVIVSGMIMSIALLGFFDPFPKKAILKAVDMSQITGLDGQWEQTTIHMFENMDPPYALSKKAAHSIMYFSNSTAHLAIAITVAEITSAEGATEQLSEEVNRSSGNAGAIDIGEGGALYGNANINDATIFDSAYIYFHKGTYFVMLYFQGNVATLAFIEHVAQVQASRLQDDSS